MAHQGYEFALEPIETFQPGEMRRRSLVGGVLGIRVFVHGEEIADVAGGVSNAGRAPVQPHLGAVGPQRTAVRLDAVRCASPQGLEDFENARELVRMQVCRDRGAGHLLRARAQQSRHSRVHVDDVHVRPHPGDAERRVREDLVEQPVAPLDLGLRSLAVQEQPVRVTMRKNVAGDEQKPDAAGQRRLEAVEVLVGDRLAKHHDRPRRHRHPWQRELP